MKTKSCRRLVVISAAILWLRALPGCGPGVALNPDDAGTGGSAGQPSTDANTAGAGAGNTGGADAASTGGMTGTSNGACPSAPGGAMEILTCGAPWPPNAGRDAPDAVVTPDGETVALNRCLPTQHGGCGNGVFRWTRATGATQLAADGWAFALSADGKTVLAERGVDNATRLSLWTEGAFTDLPAALGIAPTHLLSADGKIVVSQMKTSVDVEQTARWTAAGGVVGLGDAAGGAFYSGPVAMTPDGSVVAGYGNTAAGQEPLLWTAMPGAVVDLLSDPAPMGVQTVATAISDDGQTVVGTGYGSSGAYFRWTAASGVVALAANYPDIGAGLAGGYFFIWRPRLQLSAGGDAVTGTTSANELGFGAVKAFRWTPTGGVVDLTAHDPSIVRAASADGRRVLGSRVASSDPSMPFSPIHHPFVWDETRGARDLATLLEQGGAKLDGIALGDPIALSADGTTIVGHASVVGGAEIVYRVKLAD